MAAVLGVLAGLAAAGGGAQVHLALGTTPSELVVAWRAENEAKQSYVEYGRDCDSLDRRAEGDSRKFAVDVNRTWYTRTAAMTHLEADTKYCYRVSDGEEKFVTVHRRRTAPFRHILFADMGAKGAHALCDACSIGSELCDASVCAKSRRPHTGLVSEVATADLFFHAGDFAYDLGDRNGEVGDAFMDNVEQLAAHVPYMVNHGNHEDVTTSLPHYLERFRNMPSNADIPTFRTANGATTNSMYYSFDHGLVHYVAFSTELWSGLFQDGDGKVSNETFVEWLKADLALANSRREQYPWIVVSGHRAFYTSVIPGWTFPKDEVIRTALEDILFDNGVDIVLNGHVHNYERSWPTYKGKSAFTTTDMPAPMYIVSGGGGCNETATAFDNAQPHWSAFRANTYSYSRMTVHNATHVHWQQVQTDPVSFPSSDYGGVIDDVWFVQHTHGPFSRKTAPQATAAAAGLQRTYDRFTPEFLGIAGAVDVPPSRPTWEHAHAFQQRYGAEAYKAVLSGALRRLNDLADVRNASGGDQYLWYRVNATQNATRR
eukprot:TRINITY_DN3024_c2_g1_i1.p1 TRINITY_DN3024_c2_g1~~TRINITY_DN3024_c2_g1_i1.p1  ORF type:complete len:544 (+),score=139.92 TRINITY_DN3024_c2_g1_i1:42-1673(+)